ncbi:hypothetical protein [Patulibacter minatonensis]|uniref:hypothetical protein n=1 Tax=Patulibacter minatonensis TaxID=298163 RepID=UPI00047BAC6B|nr:hypothetical protein [Patulibacter minatonensis]
MFRRSRAAAVAPAEAEGSDPPADAPIDGTDAAPTASRDDTPSATPASAPRDAPRTLADLPELVRTLESFGHDIRLSDQLGSAAVPERLSVIAYRILEAGVGIIGRRFPDGQQLHLRVRADDQELLVSIQSTGLDGLGQQGLVPESDRAVVRSRIEAIGGKLTLRRTPSGNWIGVVRLPMTGWDDREPPDTGAA